MANFGLSMAEKKLEQQQSKKQFGDIAEERGATSGGYVLVKDLGER